MTQVNVDRRAHSRTPAPRPYWRSVVSAFCLSAPLVMVLLLVLPFLMGEDGTGPHAWIKPGILPGVVLGGGLLALAFLRVR